MDALQALKPVTVVPTSRRLEIQVPTVTLKQIDSVRVRCTRNQAYAVEIYHAMPSARTRSQIATSRELQDPERAASSVSLANSSSSPQSLTSSDVRVSKPVADIERSYADFLGLQAQLLQCVHVAHKAIPCEFCSEVSSAAMWGGTRSSAMAMLTMTEDELTATFTTFVNELLQLTKTRFASRRGPCAAQARVPQMLHAFLVNEW